MSVTTVQPLSSLEDETRNSRVCTNCVHINVCSLYRAIAPLIENSFKDKKPFDAVKLAVICKEFMPVIATNVLRRKR